MLSLIINVLNFIREIPAFRDTEGVYLGEVSYEPLEWYWQFLIFFSLFSLILNIILFIALVKKNKKNNKRISYGENINIVPKERNNKNFNGFDF